MQTGKMNLVELSNELERRKETTVDYVVNTNHVRAVALESGVYLDIPSPNGSGNVQFRLQPWAHRQLAERIGIPYRYYKKMLDAEKYGLIEANVNAWLPEMGSKGDPLDRLFRIQDGQVRAYLSNQYNEIDHYRLLDGVLEELNRIAEQGRTVEVHQCLLTDTRMHIKVVDKSLMDYIEDPGDIIHGGIEVRNSEVGDGAFQVSAYVLRVKCTNGLIGPANLRRVHLGKKIDRGIVNWSNETRRLEMDTLVSQARDIMKDSLDPESFAKMVQKMRNAHETPIEDAVRVVQGLGKEYGLSEDRRNDLLARFDSKTQYGLANAITESARDEKNPDEAIKLEELGGKVLDLTKKKLDNLAEAAEP